VTVATTKTNYTFIMMRKQVETVTKIVFDEWITEAILCPCSTCADHRNFVPAENVMELDTLEPC